MRQVLLITTATVLGLATAGCELFGGGGTTTTTTQSPVAVSPVPSPAASPAFSQPTVEAKNTPKGILPPDLISSTDPNQRVQQIKGNRNDPFALLPTTPTVQLPEGVTLSTPTTIPVPARIPSGTAGGTAQPRTTAPGTPGSAGRSSNPSGGTTSASKPAPRSPIKAQPPRPQPELAKAVKVTGIVQVGDMVYAIVDAPNEPSSRYIQEGQRLAGGQVLVKRIETNRAEPVVVLEQYGVEVVRAVGEGGAPAGGPGTPAAMMPTSSIPAT